MLLSGTIEIAGMVLTATVDVEPLKPKRKYVSFCPNVGENGKWRAYKVADGRNKHLGYYDNETDALQAVAQGVNLASTVRDARKGVYRIQRSKGFMWRSTYVPAVGRALRLGDYATQGAAILVRDVVARRCGGVPLVVDYEMPLGFVSNAIARSYITEAVPVPGTDEIAEYGRRVDELSGVVREGMSVTALVASGHLAALTIPPELWRVQQPSRSGRSPFDEL